METLEFSISGMTCQHCVQTVTGALKAAPHVLGATVDLEEGLAHVETDGAAEISTLIERVHAAGYEAKRRG